jgi:hypothetical protein
MPPQRLQQLLLLWAVVFCIGPLLCRAQGPTSSVDVAVGQPKVEEKIEEGRKEVEAASDSNPTPSDEQKDEGKKKKKGASSTVQKDTQDDPAPLSLWGIITGWLGWNGEEDAKPTPEEMMSFTANYHKLEDESNRLEKEWADKESIPSQIQDEVIETIDVDDLATSSTFDDLASQRLRIWTTAPAAVGFPVIFAAVLTDPPSTETRYEWHLPGNY